MPVLFTDKALVEYADFFGDRRTLEKIPLEYESLSSLCKYDNIQICAL